MSIWVAIVAPSWLLGFAGVGGTCAGGLLAVAVSHAFAVAYEARRWRNQQRKHHSAVSCDAMLLVRVASHLSHPEGLLLLVLYLVGTWYAGVLPPSYYETLGRGVSFRSVAAQLVVQDAFMYAGHRAQHYWKLRSHHAHHLIKIPDAFDAFDGSVTDTVLMILMPFLLTAHALKAANVTVNVYDYMCFGSLYANALFFLHSDAPHSWDNVFRRIGLGTQREHHAHHAKPCIRFGHLLTWWDVCAGTSI